MSHGDCAVGTSYQVKEGTSQLIHGVAWGLRNCLAADQVSDMASLDDLEASRMHWQCWGDLVAPRKHW